jgi:hypothetical protein
MGVNPWRLFIKLCNVGAAPGKIAVIGMSTIESYEPQVNHQTQRITVA